MIHIAEKENELAEIARKLKEDFVGLDDQIDKIIDNLKVWYIMPELLTRPVIINLWGMTGTGKTDLVRRLSKYLKMKDRLFEVQMDADVEAGWGKVNTLKEALAFSDLSEEDRGIILLDEFQRFRTVSKTGEDVCVKRYSDVWMLLSDGVFNTGASSRKQDLDLEIWSISHNIARSKGEDEKAKSEKGGKGKTIPFADRKIGIYQAKMIKKMVRLNKSLRELSVLTYSELLPILESASKDQSTYDGMNYRKSLIFVCGNLDDAYDMSAMTADADQDADVLHKYSKNVSVVTVKKCLSRMFKPEQIARFGNNHVIYPCINSENYRKIIRKTLDKSLLSLKDITDIECSYSNALVELLYRNFVYPAQGVRPVFSGVGSFLSKVIPPCVFAFKKDQFTGQILLTVKGSVPFAHYRDPDVWRELPYLFDLDDIKKAIHKDKLFCYAVHEAGHILTYCELFNYAPKFVNIELSRSEGAFVIPNRIFGSKKAINDEICVLMGGIAAEDMVFGPEDRSVGCSCDILKATEKAIAMARKQGLYNAKSLIGSPLDQLATKNYNTDIAESNEKVEEIVRINLVKAKSIIGERMEVLKKISDFLIEQKRIGGNQLKDLLNSEYPNLQYIDPLDLKTNDDIVFNYENAYSKAFDEYGV